MCLNCLDHLVLTTGLLIVQSCTHKLGLPTPPYVPPVLCFLCRLRVLDWYITVRGLLFCLLVVLPYYHTFRLLAGGTTACEYYVYAVKHNDMHCCKIAIFNMLLTTSSLQGTLPKCTQISDTLNQRDAIPLCKAWSHRLSKHILASFGYVVLLHITVKVFDGVNRYYDNV